MTYYKTNNVDEIFEYQSVNNINIIDDIAYLVSNEKIKAKDIVELTKDEYEKELSKYRVYDIDEIPEKPSQQDLLLAILQGQRDQELETKELKEMQLASMFAQRENELRS